MSPSTRDAPNVLVFMTDDHGPWGAHCLGTPGLCTPAMDELARRGAMMRRAFTPSPVCSPARASFYTGRLPSMHGIHDWLSESRSALNHPGIRDQPTLAHHLGVLGYETAHIGKWHCGRSWEPQCGFDLWAAFSQGPHFGDVQLWEQGQTITQRGYRDALVGDRTVRFLREREQQGDTRRPFFVSVGFTATHSAFAGHAPRLVNQYRDVAARELPDEPLDERHAFIRRGRPERDEERCWHAQYYAAIATIDEQVGRIMDTLDALGETENTLIVYTSDHGHNNSHHGIWCKGNATVPQNFFEESIGVPHLVAWPGRIEGGQVHKAMIDHCDLFAMVLDAAGADADAIGTEVNSPGRSYLPLLTGRSSAPIKDVQFCEYGNARMARSERYKLIRRYPGPNGHFPDELYDLVDDPRERTNRIDDPQLANTAADLSDRLDAHFGQYEDPARSGRRIGEFEPTSLTEPWRMTEPDV